MMMAMMDGKRRMSQSSRADVDGGTEVKGTGEGIFMSLSVWRAGPSIFVAFAFYLLLRVTTYARRYPMLPLAGEMGRGHCLPYLPPCLPTLFYLPTHPWQSKSTGSAEPRLVFVPSLLLGLVLLCCVVVGVMMVGMGMVLWCLLWLTLRSCGGEEFIVLVCFKELLLLLLLGVLVCALWCVVDCFLFLAARAFVVVGYLFKCAVCFRVFLFLCMALGGALRLPCPCRSGAFGSDVGCLVVSEQLHKGLVSQKWGKAVEVRRYGSGIKVGFAIWKHKRRLVFVCSFALVAFTKSYLLLCLVCLVVLLASLRTEGG
jgi:hypothetical protein